MPHGRDGKDGTGQSPKARRHIVAARTATSLKPIRHRRLNHQHYQQNDAQQRDIRLGVDAIGNPANPPRCGPDTQP